MSTLSGKSVLITGGTGSFGKAFVERLSREGQVSEIVVYSRDELKQFEMQASINSKLVRFVLGDVRDYKRLLQATTGIDVVIHAAAMKQIPAAENNPMEAIKTNIFGAENIVNAAIENDVSRVIALSTDKAANPANLYGATKLCSDKLMVAGNTLSPTSKTKFSVVRYGNVLGSRGSVIPFFLEQSRTGMITIDEGVQFVLSSLENMQGGEIFVPKIPSFKILDVAKVVAPGVSIKIIGIRPGEKLHEIMITEDDSFNTMEFEDYYAILSPVLLSSNKYQTKGKMVEEGFRFSSENNPRWHTEETFAKVLKESGIV